MINKLTLLCLLLLISSLPVFAQGTLVKDDENSLYYKALKVYLEENEKEYSKLFPQRDFHNVIVVKNNLITEKLPDKIGRFKIAYADYDELTVKAKNIAEKKKTAQTLFASEFQPIVNDKNKLVITISEYKVGYEGNRLTLGLSDGIRIEFKFDCSTGEYVVDKFEFFGV
jgi:hypothetical protein